MRQTLLALTAVALVAAAAGAPRPAAAQDSGGRAACTAGAIADGTYTTTERQRKNRGADDAADGEKPRRAGKKAAAEPSAEGTEITEVTLTWQCGGTGPDGAFIPAGYKLEVRGECPSGTCDLGTTVAMPGKDDGDYMALLADETVGFRQIKLGSKRRGLSLTVRTEVEGARRASPARYSLEKKSGT